jgi:hypothetical protein
MRATIAEGPHALEMLKPLRAVMDGDFSMRIPLGDSGIESDIALALNEIIAMNEAMATALQRKVLPVLQTRVFSLLHQTLAIFVHLALGNRESLTEIRYANCYDRFSAPQHLYRRVQ